MQVQMQMQTTVPASELVKTILPCSFLPSSFLFPPSFRLHPSSFLLPSSVFLHLPSSPFLLLATCFFLPSLLLPSRRKDERNRKKERGRKKNKRRKKDQGREWTRKEEGRKKEGRRKKEGTRKEEGRRKQQGRKKERTTVPASKQNMELDSPTPGVPRVFWMAVFEGWSLPRKSANIETSGKSAYWMRLKGDSGHACYSSTLSTISLLLYCLVTVMSRGSFERPIVISLSKIT